LKQLLIKGGKKKAEMKDTATFEFSNLTFDYQGKAMEVKEVKTVIESSKI